MGDGSASRQDDDPRSAYCYFMLTVFQTIQFAEFMHDLQAKAEGGDMDAPLMVGQLDEELSTAASRFGAPSGGTHGKHLRRLLPEGQYPAWCVSCTPTRGVEHQMRTFVWYPEDSEQTSEIRKGPRASLRELSIVAAARPPVILTGNTPVVALFAADRNGTGDEFYTLAREAADQEIERLSALMEGKSWKNQDPTIPL